MAQEPLAETPVCSYNLLSQQNALKVTRMPIQEDLHPLIFFLDTCLYHENKPRLPNWRMKHHVEQSWAQLLLYFRQHGKAKPSQNNEQTKNNKKISLILLVIAALLPFLVQTFRYISLLRTPLKCSLCFYFLTHNHQLITSKFSSS